MTTTPNMHLTLPVVSLTPGPEWASNINADLSLIDSHNHTFGNGALIPTAGLNINADLTFNNVYSALNLASTGYSDQASASHVSSIYSTGGDLWWNNGSNVPVQITNGISVAGASGTITGLVSPASATFNVGTGTFTFQSNTNQAAQMDVGPLLLRRTTSLSPAITIIPASGLTNWTLTLPPSPPASVASVLGISTSGAVSNLTPDSTLTVTSSTIGVANSGIQTVNIANNQVTISKMASLPFVKTTSTAGNLTGVTDWENVPNLSVLFSVAAASTGRPIVICMQPSQGSLLTGSYISASNVGRLGINVVGPSGTAVIGVMLFQDNIRIPTSSYSVIYFPPSVGLYTFSAQVAKDATASLATDFTFNNVLMFAYQI